MITANTRGINYNKIDDKEVMRPMTDLEIRVIIFDDTTEKTISFIVYYPANYPDVKKKMLNEIDRIFKMTNSSITENDVNNLTYRKTIVKEVKYDIDLLDKKTPLKTESGIIAACTELLVEIKLRN
ncbi:unnamed protein product [Rhizophagus irregularis]|nr:unnamed protein product [Rhizophagus irregularis]